MKKTSKFVIAVLLGEINLSSIKAVHLNLSNSGSTYDRVVKPSPAGLPWENDSLFDDSWWGIKEDEANYSKADK